MASRTTPGAPGATGVDAPRGNGAYDNNGGARRQFTETKASFKTTEFLAYLGVLIGLFIAGLVIEDNGGEDFLNASRVWLYATILTVGYMISRGLAKSGTREPYWSDGTNQDRH